MPITVASITHPYWAALGARAGASRTEKRLSQSKVATRLGLSVREYAALESGFIPPEVAKPLGRISLAAFDETFDWEPGTARKTFEEALAGARSPVPSFRPADRSTYPQAAWARLGKAIQNARLSHGMTRSTLAYAAKSSTKTIMRLEAGRVYGDPRTAPPGDYNSERYMLKRLAFVEMALEWGPGQAAEILAGEGGTVPQAA
ncbi:helix-turn-helix domain-containing protein [Streptomyces albidoflavus]|uniref:helix-turn-helix domain-containing protein n=1 Tax=Streptomyces albidoflavus TaxID=1886 RepID=UPI0033E7EE15